MSTRKSRGNRDTAKDIILGLAPSGAGPRQPKEGVATPKRPRSLDSRGYPLQSALYPKEQPVSRRPTAPVQTVQPTVVVDRRPDNTAILGLQSQLSQLQKENKDLISQEQDARRRLEANQNDLQRRLYTEASSRNTGDVQRQLGAIDGKMVAMNNDLNALRSQMDRQIHDLMSINNDIKSRPVVDPSKIASSNQQLDGKLRDLHGQLMQLKQLHDFEKTERNREVRGLGDQINKLQEIIRQQDQDKRNVLENLARKGDMDKEKLTEEARRLNEKITLITTEVTKNTAESLTRMRDDFGQRTAGLETAIRIQGENIAEMDREMKMRWEAEQQQDNEQSEVFAKQLAADRAKNKERFQKVNEALAALEHHLELGNKKIDKLVNSEIQARQLHEKGLLSKIQEVEDKLQNYVGGMNKTIEEVRIGRDAKVPSLDVDALRREMEAIAADKNKLSMEGLLKLEEKMTRVQTGLYHEKKDLQAKIAGLDDGDATRRLQGQMSKLNSVSDDMDKASDRIRDKVERQIPQDLNELSAKADNIKHQLNSRLDKEEEERYLAIKELQEAFQRLQARNGPIGNQGGSGLQRDVDECKTAIKKLAESVTTVKNVLDKKITDEMRARERDVARLSGSNGTIQ